MEDFVKRDTQSPPQTSATTWFSSEEGSIKHTTECVQKGVRRARGGGKRYKGGERVAKSKKNLYQSLHYER